MAEKLGTKLNKLMKNNNIEVHRSHCCILHGCKYGDPDCPVESGNIEQKYPCEFCSEYGIETIEDLKKYKDGKVQICPHCKHII